METVLGCEMGRDATPAASLCILLLNAIAVDFGWKTEEKKDDGIQKGDEKRTKSKRRVVELRNHVFDSDDVGAMSQSTQKYYLPHVPLTVGFSTWLVWTTL